MDIDIAALHSRTSTGRLWGYARDDRQNR